MRKPTITSVKDTKRSSDIIITLKQTSDDPTPTAELNIVLTPREAISLAQDILWSVRRYVVD
jgi:hypothetical protein